MPEVQDLNLALFFADSIVDSNRSVQHNSDAGAPVDRSAGPRELAEQLYMIEQRDAKTLSSVGVISSDVIEDYSKIL